MEAAAILLAVFDSVKDGRLQGVDTFVAGIFSGVRYPSAMVHLLTIFTGGECP
jgi:hypothetical protein